MGTQLPSPKRGHNQPIFGPFLLWPNGWMHQDATWYGGRPQTRQVCSMGTKPSPQKGQSPPIFSPRLLWPNNCMNQDATWYGGLRDIVLDGDPATATAPNFRPMSAVAKRLYVYGLPLGMEVGFGPGDFVIDGDPDRPRKKGHTHPLPT